MKSYRDLEIFTLAYDLAVSLHKISLELPKYELYEEGSQIRRASKGIVANIVEGYGRKRYKADFVKYLVYAHASCDETIVHMHFIRDLHLTKQQQIEQLIEQYNSLGKKINRFIKYVDTEWH